MRQVQDSAQLPYLWLVRGMQHTPKDDRKSLCSRTLRSREVAMNAAALPRANRHRLLIADDSVEMRGMLAERRGAVVLAKPFSTATLRQTLREVIRVQRKA
jgi:hypothetical protein